jgi:short-subunit dehydrogenase
MTHPKDIGAQYEPTMQLRDKIAVITGASSGIGAASAKALAEQGARVIMLARGADRLHVLAAEIAQIGGMAHVFPVDLSDAQATALVCAQIMREVGTPDVVFNNAGVGRWLYTEETDSAELIQMTAVPYFAAFNVTKAFLPAMMARGSGRIVNITSPAAFVPWPGATAYVTARWAIRGFTEALRADLYSSGVGVTLLIPGEVDTSYFDNNPGARDRIPWINRFYKTLSAEEVAAMLLVAIVKEKRQFARPHTIAATIWLAQHFPRTVQWVSIKTGHRRKM